MNDRTLISKISWPDDDNPAVEFAVYWEYDHHVDLSHYGQLTNKISGIPDDDWFIDLREGKVLGPPVEEPDYPDFDSMDEIREARHYLNLQNGSYPLHYEFEPGRTDYNFHRTDFSPTLYERYSRIVNEYEAISAEYDDKYQEWDDNYGRELIEGDVVFSHYRYRDFGRYFYGCQGVDESYSKDDNLKHIKQDCKRLIECGIIWGVIILTTEMSIDGVVHDTAILGGIEDDDDLSGIIAEQVNELMGIDLASRIAKEIWDNRR